MAELHRSTLGNVLLLEVDADPNATEQAPRGSLALDSANGTVYVNTDSVTAWDAVGAAAPVLAPAASGVIPTIPGVDYYLADTATGLTDFLLFDPSLVVAGTRMSFKATDPLAGFVMILTPTAGTLEGAAGPIVYPLALASVEVVSDGVAAWWVVG
jgi:hypothetical protein